MSAPVQAGEVLDGKYRVERVLGIGGMGVVVAAVHLQLDERVALKFLLPEALENQEAVARFAREARAAVKVKSEHVARVTDVGTLPNGAPYMVMEYLTGQDLGQLLDARGPLPLLEAVDYVLQACEALAEAHSLGIIHRDLKPANLFLTQRADGSSLVKVLDFGISKLLDPAGGRAMTQTSTLMGSPNYMSPEQMLSAKGVDARSDIWALGAILYELVTGQPPFVADTLPQLCALILQEPLRPASHHRKGLPPAFEQLLATCLTKEAAGRYPDVGALALALRDFAPDQSRLSIDRAQRVSSGARLSQGEIAAGYASPRPSSPALGAGSTALVVSPAHVVSAAGPAAGPEAQPAGGGTIGSWTQASDLVPRRDFRPLLLGIAVLGLLVVAVLSLLQRGEGAAASPGAAASLVDPGRVASAPTASGQPPAVTLVDPPAASSTAPAAAAPPGAGASKGRASASRSAAAVTAATTPPATATPAATAPPATAPAATAPPSDPTTPKKSIDMKIK